MENKFEDFIRNNKENFDFREPDPAIWKKIEADIKPRRIINWKIIASRAAAVLIIFAASYMVHELVDRNDDPNLAVKKNLQKEAKEIVIPELREAELYYSSMVNEKLEEIKPILATCPAIKDELQYDMSELDSLYKELKLDLKDNIANQEVVEAIIENYRMRVDILEDLLNDLKPEEGDCVSKNDDYEL